MAFRKLFIANRGEIAVRILRAAATLDLPTVAMFAAADADALHVRLADEAVAVPGDGAAPYLDMEAVAAAALAAGADAVHPGYGFLSESAAFARLCRSRGLVFVGPSPEALDLLGDKARARRLARELGVPVLAGGEAPASLDEARAFLAAQGAGGAMMIKALAGGGGRGMRVVERMDEVEEAYARCRSEAKAAFGRDEVYVERLVRRARHVEVQTIGDATGAVSHLWERDCTVQRRRQKLIEIAPAPGLDPRLRRRLLEATSRLAAAAGCESLCTFEYLIDLDAGADESFAFMEANPRLQVEHAVTEAVTGVDLVVAQLRVARGETLAEVGLAQADVPPPRGVAVQLRVNMETMTAEGEARPSGGTLTAFEPPTGPGVRVDTFGYGGYRTSPDFDSLLAKVIVHSPADDLSRALALAGRALREFRIEGLHTNAAFLAALLRRPELAEGRVDTRFVEAHAAALVAEAADMAAAGPAVAPAMASASGPFAPAGAEPVRAPLSGRVVSLEAAPGSAVRAGGPVAVLEAMKMEHVVVAPLSGLVRAAAVSVGDTVYDGDPLMFVEPADVEAAAETTTADADPDHVRGDLAAVLARRRAVRDEGRPEAVARRRKTGQRTARENLGQLFDGGDFLEYGEFAVAAQRRRRSREELEAISPADGLIAGVGQVNGDQFGEEAGRCVAMAYDYTVMAGTQGYFNHHKTDRMLGLAETWRAPVVMFTEGGGGRPGDVDAISGSGLAVPSFASYARLSGLAPVVGINSGFCFAGNAAFLGCSDVVIATRNSNIGMGGPAMIEGGGLGVFKPTEIGPAAEQAANGVIDLLVEDEVEAVDAARRYLSYFQGATRDWTCADQRRLRTLIPENRLRVYDIRAVIAALADAGSTMELRRDYGAGMVTALIRIEGRPFGLIANNPAHLGGAIDAPAADKASRFMQLCDAFDLPILSLCDTPGFMVGPEVERTAQVRRVSRMFVTAAGMTVPVFFVVLRKAYGLGAQAMAAGSLHEPFFSVSWPTGELGPMGLEGAVRLGFRRELEAETDPAAQKALFDRLVAQSYERGKALNVASLLELDSVIDPRDTRAWIVRGLRATPAPRPRAGKKRPSIDTW